MKQILINKIRVIKPENIVKGQMVGLLLNMFGTLISSILILLLNKSLWYIGLTFAFSLLFQIFGYMELYQKYITLKDQANFPIEPEEEKKDVEIRLSDKVEEELKEDKLK